MNKGIGLGIISVALIAGLFSGVLFPANASAADAPKIAYVDLGILVRDSAAGKAATDELNAWAAPRKVAIEDKIKTIKKLSEELDRQASALSADARKAKEEELTKLDREQQRMRQDFEADARKKEDQYTSAIVGEIRNIIDTVGKEGDYTIILENVPGIVLYAKKEIDLTDKVMKRYNEWKAKQKK